MPTLTYMTKSHNAPLIFCMLYLAQLKQSLSRPTKQLEVMNDADHGGFQGSFPFMQHYSENQKIIQHKITGTLIKINESNVCKDKRRRSLGDGVTNM